MDSASVLRAEAAAKIQFAICLLHNDIRVVLQKTLSVTEQLDFNNCLRKVEKNIGKFVLDSESQEQLLKTLARARKTRNEYCHQDFDFNHFEHAVEGFLKLASLLGLSECREKIMEHIGLEKYSSTLSEEWEKLKALGNEHYKGSRWTEAMNCFTEAIRINPKSAVLYSNRALCEIRLAKFDLAREDAEDAIEIDPKQVKFYRTLSEALQQLQLYKEALDACQDGLKVDPRDETLLLRARDCRALGTVEQIRTLDVSPDEAEEEPIDTSEVAEQLRAAADQDLPGALMSLQQLMRSGAGGAKALDESKKLVQERADSNEKEALFLIGMNYARGEGGFPKDLTEAENYLRKASDLNHVSAFVELGDLLLKQRRSEDAVHFLRKAAESGNKKSQRTLGLLLALGHGCSRDESESRRWLRSKMSQSALDDIIKHSAIVAEFEAAQNLSQYGLSYSERIDRYCTSFMPSGSTKDAIDAMHRLFYKTLDNPPHPACGLASNLSSKMPLMALRAAQGSKIAQKFFVALDLVKQASLALKSKSTAEAFRLYRQADRTWQLLPIDVDIFRNLFAAAKEALDKNPRDADALFVILNYYSANQLCSIAELVRMALNCTNLNPNVADFHYMLGNMYGFNREYAASFKSIERALELEWEPDWLYSRASALRLQNTKDRRIVIKAYEEFVSMNEPDHRLIPEALFCIAEEYLRLHDQRKSKEYFEKGLRAERPDVRLPYFEPNDDFPSKRMVKLFFEAAGIKVRMPTSPSASKESSGIRCGNCGKAGASQRCSRCKETHYCGRDCQLQHWKEHKKRCGV